MKLILVDEKYLRRIPADARARKATCCGRAIRAGQYVLHHRFDANAFAQTDVHFHAACLKARLECVPEDNVAPTDVDAADAALRRSINRLAS